MAASGFKIEDRDFGYNRVRAVLRSLKGAEVHVGYFNPRIAAIALWNEKGTKHTPARSFLARTIDDGRDRFLRFAATSLKRALLGQVSPAGVLILLGNELVNGVKKMITRIADPPNAPATVRAKGFNDPLIHTGRLRNETGFRIRMGHAGGGGSGAAT